MPASPSNIAANRSTNALQTATHTGSGMARSADLIDCVQSGRADASRAQGASWIFVAVVIAIFMMSWQCHLASMFSHNMPSGEKPAEQKHDRSGSTEKLHEPNLSVSGVPSVKHALGAQVNRIHWRDVS